MSDCPMAFVQGGLLVHAMDESAKVKPQGDMLRQENNSDCTDTQQRPDVMTMLESEIASIDASPEGPPPAPKQAVVPLRASRQPSLTYNPSTHMMADVMSMRRDQVLDRFKALTINGTSMTEASIGGYQLDMSKTAQAAREYVPLPPVALPIIFVDKDLNFAHHFFNGMEHILGRQFLLKIAEIASYSARDSDGILATVKEIIDSGYIESDDELTIFVKRVLRATFEPMTTSHIGQGDTALLVRTNLYGFQYIEQGMSCKESDLKMWIHLAYMQYKLAWFNAFKSSGVPSFALEGVQTRYESDKQPTRSSDKHMGTILEPYPVSKDNAPSTTGGDKARRRIKRSSFRHPDAAGDNLSRWLRDV